MSEDLPDALAELVHALVRRGFGVIVDEHAKGFGGREIVLRAPDRPAIRLLKDRGLWDVEVELAGQWEMTHSVLLALDGATPEARAQSHAERRDTALAVVDRLAAGDADLSRIQRQLAHYRREYNRQLGVDDAE